MISPTEKEKRQEEFEGRADPERQGGIDRLKEQARSGGNAISEKDEIGGVAWKTLASAADKGSSEEKSGLTSPGGLTSPDGVLMLCVAGILDLISLIPVINVVSDILGIIIIGGWLVVTRPGEAIKKAVKRFLIACGVELVPVISIAPTWTWFVYKVLKDS